MKCSLRHSKFLVGPARNAILNPARAGLDSGMTKNGPFRLFTTRPCVQQKLMGQGQPVNLGGTYALDLIPRRIRSKKLNLSQKRQKTPSATIGPSDKTWATIANAFALSDSIPGIARSKHATTGI
jgi:hypothetical protein